MVGRLVVVASALLVVVACGKESAQIEAEHAPARTLGETSTPLVVSSPTTRAALPPLPSPHVDWTGHFAGEWLGTASPTTGHTYGHLCNLFVGDWLGDGGENAAGYVSCDGWQMGRRVLFRGRERSGRLDLFAVSSTGAPPVDNGAWFASITHRKGKLYFSWVDNAPPREENAQPLRRLSP